MKITNTNYEILAKQSEHTTLLSVLLFKDGQALPCCVIKSFLKSPLKTEMTRRRSGKDCYKPWRRSETSATDKAVHSLW